MINVYIISGFLGAGKTTLIKHLLKSERLGKTMLIENEFGEIGIDSNLFDDQLNVREINSGCICCSLKGDLIDALDEIRTYDIDTLLIEPSGVGKLSEIMDAVVSAEDMQLACHLSVVDAKKALSYHRNYKEFFDDQVIAANAILLSKIDIVDDIRLHKVNNMLRELNDEAYIVTTDYKELSYDELFNVMSDNVCEGEHCTGCKKDLEHFMALDLDELVHHHHHHHDHDHEHHHEHHHDHDHEHHHHHEHGEHCTCGCHHHDHDAEDVFSSIGFETIKTFTKESLHHALKHIKDYAIRAKGFVKGENTWYYFDLAGDEVEIKEGPAKYTGLVTIIGQNLDREELEGIFSYD